MAEQRTYDANDPQKNTPGSHPAGSVPALDPKVYNPDGTLKNPQSPDQQNAGNTAGQPNQQPGQGQNPGGTANPTGTNVDVPTSQDPNASANQHPKPDQNR